MNQKQSKIKTTSRIAARFPIQNCTGLLFQSSGDFSLI